MHSKDKKGLKMKDEIGPNPIHTDAHVVKNEGLLTLGNQRSTDIFNVISRNPISIS